MKINTTLVKFWQLQQAGVAHYVVPVAAFVVLFAGAGTYFLMTSQAATPCTHYQYGFGGNGKCVKYIQQTLNGYVATRRMDAKAFPNKLPDDYKGAYITPVDGQFGSKTETQVKVFQRYTGFPVDGKVGKQTWHDLCLLTRNITVLKGTSATLASYVRTGNTARKAAGCT